MDDISEDLHASMRELTVVDNKNENLPATRQPARQLEVATDEPRRAARTDVATRTGGKNEVSADRESHEEDDRTEEERRELTTEQAPAKGRGKDNTPAPTDAFGVAPVTWKGAAKKDWPNLSLEVRQEIIRRERQIDLTLTQTADQRKYADVMYQTIAPYEIHLKAEGANHVQAVDHLMRMAHVLRAGTPQAKAKMLAGMFFDHAVDLQLLDTYITARLEGKQPEHDPLLATLDAKLAPITQFMQEMANVRQRGAEQTQTSAAQTINELLDDPDIGDMLEDVRQDMADLLDLATKRGKILPLRDAAVRAIMAHPEHSVTYNQRQLAKQAQQQTDKANRSRRAGVSLEDDGAPSASEDDGGEDDSILGAINASVRELSRRR